MVLYGSDEEIHVRYKNRYGRTRSYWTTYEGVLPAVERRHVETDSESQRERLEEFMREVPCRACGGARLRPESLAVTVGDLNISELTDRSIRDTLAFTHQARLTEREQMIAERLMKEIRERLQFLVDVGLDYLTLSRASATLAGRGGPADPARDADRERARGRPLHPRRALDRSAPARQPAADRHAWCGCGTWGTRSSSSSTTRRRSAASDHVVDIGPGAGNAGGEIVYTGDLKGLLECDGSLTGAFLSGRRVIPTPRFGERRANAG